MPSPRKTMTWFSVHALSTQASDAFFYSGMYWGYLEHLGRRGLVMRLVTAFRKVKRKRGPAMSDSRKLSVVRELLDMVPDRLQRPLLADIGALIAMADSWDDLIWGARREANRRVLADPADPLADGWVKFVGLFEHRRRGRGSGRRARRVGQWPATRHVVGAPVQPRHVRGDAPARLGGNLAHDIGCGGCLVGDAPVHPLGDQANEASDWRLALCTGGCERGPSEPHSRGCATSENDVKP